MTRKEFNYIKYKLGYSGFGFFDWQNDPGKWHPFIAKHFFREGKVNGEPYSAAMNEHLSGTALITVIDEVLSRLEALVIDEPINEEGISEEII